MQFRLGLVGKGTDGSGKVMSWQQQGDDVSVEAEYRMADYGDATAVVDQLGGLVETGRESLVVPLEWDDEPKRNGFYRVTGVDLPVDRPLLNVHKVKAKLSLSRVAGSSSLAGEHVLWGADRQATPTTGSWVGNEPNPWVAYLDSWGPHTVDLVTPGQQARQLTATSAMNTLLDFNSSYRISVFTTPTPATFYEGACTIRTGTPLQYVTGRRQGIDPEAWEISNGLVKITPPSTAARSFELKYRNKAGTAWSTRTRAFAFWDDNTYTDNPAGVNPRVVTVTRNTPEQVTVRLSVPFTYFKGSVALDLTLRRGSRFVQVSLSAGVASQWALGHQTGFNGAWGGIDSPTVGSIETNNDTDGNRSFLMFGSVQNVGVTFVSTGRVSNGAFNYKHMEVGVGGEIGGTSANTYDQAAYLERQYFAAMGETFRVVRP